MSAVDKSSMGRFMSSEGTDAATSNVIAGAVSDVWRAHFGNEWVPFSVRYGIAHEVQRRLAQRSADPVRCPKCGGPHPFHDPACVVHPDLIQDQSGTGAE